MRFQKCMYFYKLHDILTISSPFLVWQVVRGGGAVSSSESALYSTHYHQLKKLSSDRDIENYAQTHLNRHKKGIFGKRVSLANMLAWSKVTQYTILSHQLFFFFLLVSKCEIFSIFSLSLLPG